jgi:hypothetical protein
MVSRGLATVSPRMSTAISAIGTDDRWRTMEGRLGKRDRPDVAGLSHGPAQESRSRSAAALTGVAGGPAARAVAAAAAADAGRAHVVGLTGPPAGRQVDGKRPPGHGPARRGPGRVLAVDLSSPFSGGALLGDRVRMSEHEDAGVFIRSMATRGQLEGSRPPPQALRVLEMARCDAAIETVGVGQSRWTSSRSPTRRSCCSRPVMGMGAGRQSGDFEVADVLVVNKSDRDGAAETARELRHMIGGRRRRPEVPVLSVPRGGDRQAGGCAAAHRAGQGLGRANGGGPLERGRDRGHPGTAARPYRPCRGPDGARGPGQAGRCGRAGPYAAAELSQPTIPGESPVSPRESRVSARWSHLATVSRASHHGGQLSETRASCPGYAAKRQVRRGEAAEPRRAPRRMRLGDPRGHVGVRRATIRVDPMRRARSGLRVRARRLRGVDAGQRGREVGEHLGAVADGARPASMARRSSSGRRRHRAAPAHVRASGAIGDLDRQPRRIDAVDDYRRRSVDQRASASPDRPAAARATAAAAATGPRHAIGVSALTALSGSLPISARASARRQRPRARRCRRARPPAHRRRRVLERVRRGLSGATAWTWWRQASS